MSAAHSDDAGAILPDLCPLAQRAWYILLGFLAFYAVTIMSATDADFLAGERQISIALLGVSVPTERFFFLAPLAAVVLYFNLRYYCLKLWAAAAVAPPEALKSCNALIPDFALFLRQGARARPRPLLSPQTRPDAEAGPCPVAASPLSSYIPARSARGDERPWPPISTSTTWMGSARPMPGARRSSRTSA